MSFPFRALFVLCSFLLVIHSASQADPIPARLKQGAGHIFLLLLDENGKTLAAGESLQTVKGYTVTTRTTFHFRDGSLDDETTVFEQRVNFRVLTDDHLQRGPAFPHPMQIRIEAVNGRVIVHDLESGKTTTPALKIPFDLANGIITQVLQGAQVDHRVDGRRQRAYVHPHPDTVFRRRSALDHSADSAHLAVRGEISHSGACSPQIGHISGIFCPKITRFQAIWVLFREAVAMVSS